jgi:glucose/arabinose dehydrogenase
MRRVARFAALGACLCAGSFAAAPAAGGAILPAGFQDSVAIEGLNEPTAVQFAGDGRVFIAEKAGRVKVFDDLADETPTLFADLRTQVYNANDRGLLGLALDPSFPARPYVYVLYTHDAPIGGDAPVWGEAGQDGDDCPDPPGADSDGCVVSGRLSRLTADGDHASAEQVLVEDWCQQFSSHSVGDLRFDAGGALYASGGDGASFLSPDYGQFGFPQENPCGDPPGGVGGDQTPPGAEGGALRSQDLLTPADPTGLNGSIIRVDPDTGEGLPGNSLYASPDANARRIVAFGLRNPFRFTIHPETGELYSGNVGWDGFEEIDRFNPTAAQPYNSGWPCYEGPAINPLYEVVGLTLCQSLYDQPGSTSAPFFHYAHGQGVSSGDECPKAAGAALSGLAFYGGGSYPAQYEGALFVADSVRGCMWTMLPGADDRPDPSTLTTFRVADEELYPGVDLELGPGGDLFFLTLFDDSGFGPGALHRIEYFPGNQPPVARLTVDRQWSPGDLEAEFDASGSSDADGDELTYEWDLSGDGTFGAPTTAATQTQTFTDEENHRVSVRVKDPDGATGIARITVYPGDTPPQLDVVRPTAALRWSVGEEIAFEASALDQEDGELPATSFDWSARLFHCPDACHAHPLQAFPAVASGSFAAPDHDYPAHIELTLTAADSRGLTETETVRIDPATVDLGIVAEPAGLTLGAGLVSAPAPFTLRAIRGSNVVLSAPEAQQLDGKTYTWIRWSDGGERVHAIVAGASATYRAYYVPPGGNPPPSAKAPSAAPPAAEPPLLPPGAAPRVSLDRHPPKRTRRRAASFWFSADVAGAAFRCRLDGGPPQPCGSPRRYRGLGRGPHSFEVVAIAPLGGGESAPLAYGWRVLPRGCRKAAVSAEAPTRRRPGCARSAGSAGRAGR